jgi:hypothetical protein
VVIRIGSTDLIWNGSIMVRIWLDRGGGPRPGRRAVACIVGHSIEAEPCP